jgi:hypothetical protein
MTDLTKGDTVGDIISKLWKVQPRLNVMGFQSSAPFPALLASIVISLIHRCAPSAIAIAVTLRLSFIGGRMWTGLAASSQGKVWFALVKT